MPIDAIGGVLNAQNTNASSNSSINQDEFIRLFLTQLQFQDPLEPVDNREFLSQLAQFTALEHARQTSQNTTDLISMNATAQAVSLLNRRVDVNTNGVQITATVSAVTFNSNGAQLTVTRTDGTVLTGIRLSQITQVIP